MDMIASAVASPGLPPPRAGIGLKPQHYEAILDPEMPIAPPGWVEVHPQNYFGFCDHLGGGAPHRWLSAIAERIPISLHSVGLSLGSADGLVEDQLARLATLCDNYRPALVSDHLSFSGNAHDRFADLLPLPYTHEALAHFVRQTDRVQQRLGRQILIENPSRMLAYVHNDMDEVAFIEALIAQTGCGLLLDINNVFVSAGNIGECAEDWLARIDPDWVGEIHLAGHATEWHEGGPLRIDDHGSAVCDEVWALYRNFVARSGSKPTLIEWDTNVPDFATLMAEADRAQAILDLLEEAGAHALAG